MHQRRHDPIAGPEYLLLVVDRYRLGGDRRYGKTHAKAEKSETLHKGSMVPVSSVITRNGTFGSVDRAAPPPK
jgi:hypothetical protein